MLCLMLLSFLAWQLSSDAEDSISMVFSSGWGWSIQTVDSDGEVGLYTSIALDSAGRPHISYCDWTNGDLKYAHWTGSYWEIQTVDSGDFMG